MTRTHKKTAPPESAGLSANIRFLSFIDIQLITGKSRVTIWRWCRAGLFPVPRQIGPNSVGWVAAEVERWAQDKAA